MARLDDAALFETFRFALGGLGTIGRSAAADGVFAFRGTLEKLHAVTPKVSDLFIPGRGFWNRQPQCRYALRFAFRREGPDMIFDVRGTVAPNGNFVFNLAFAVVVWAVTYGALPARPGYGPAWTVFLVLILGLLVILQVTQQCLVRRYFRAFLSDRPEIGIADVAARRS